MLAEHTNKEKVLCKPQSRYHLKGYVITIIRITAALFIISGKTRKDNQPVGIPCAGRTTCCLSLLFTSLPRLSAPHVYTCAPLGPTEYPICTSSVCYLKNLPAATSGLPPWAAWRARSHPASSWPLQSGSQAIWWLLVQHWGMSCEKAFQSFVLTQRESRVNY